LKACIAGGLKGDLLLTKIHLKPAIPLAAGDVEQVLEVESSKDLFTRRRRPPWACC